MKKTTTLLFIVSMFLMLTMTACGRECTCDCNCRSTVVDNSEIEATPEPTTESTPDPTFEPNESESESELEQDEEEEVDEEEKESNKEWAEKEKIHNEAKELYWSGKWDGDKPMTLHSRTVSFNEYGEIYVDNKPIGRQEADLPDNIDSYIDVESNFEYIPGEGVFALQDGSLIKYLRGKKIKVGTFKYKGLNPRHPEKYGCKVINKTYYPPDYDKDGPNGDNSCGLAWPGPGPRLYFDEESKKLLLITENPVKKVSYLYAFTDYKKAKAKYLGEIDLTYCISGCFPDGKTHLNYGDMKGNDWVWCKNGPMLYEEFEKKYGKI